MWLIWFLEALLLPLRIAPTELVVVIILRAFYTSDLWTPDVDFFGNGGGYFYAPVFLCWIFTRCCFVA
jgi:hypothetical protein